MRTLMTIGKTVTALRNLNEVFEGVIRAALQLTRAEAVGVFLKDDQTGGLILRAGQNLSRDLQERIGKPVDDDLAALVLTSRDTYIGSGEGLKRFHPAMHAATAVIYAPLIVHEAAIGLLWVANTRLPFEDYLKDLMTALADYAAIAVVNARLFTTMQERTRQLEQMAKQGPAVSAGAVPAASGPTAAQLASQIRGPLTQIMGNMNLFRTGEMGRLPPSLQAAVDVLHRQLQETIELVDRTVPPDSGGL
jgi:transcriptional regulator with GAF, ATPase, and Fis domain